MNPLRWRKMTWAIVIFSVLMLIWAIAGAAADGGCDQYPVGSAEREGCELGEDVGTGIGVTIIFILWFIGFIILSIIWFMTRGRGRVCPHCGEDVKKGRTTCKNCGYDFTIGGKPPAPTEAS
jgi:hypothetical protein